MALETDFNVSPYFDDYNEEKNFHRILFKPAVAVQARELTQLQTILQNQVERFGDYVFKDGSIIKGVSQKVQTIKHIKIRDNHANGTVLGISTMLRANTYLKGNTSGILAEVVDFADGAEVTAPDYKTLYVRYISTGTNNTQKEFSNNEVVFLVDTANTAKKVVDGFGKSFEANTLNTGATGNSLIFTVGDGIVYQKGNFILVEGQQKVIGKYTSNPNTQVGFDIKENIINSNIDDSLNDNALGSTNYQAPGADRLKLVATLTQRDANATGNSQPFFPIATFQNGEQVRVADRTDLNELGNQLAERTYEESGDYILRPFNIRVQEHLNTNTNFGFYNSDSSIRGVAGDRNKLVASVQGGGVAYIRGYRNEVRNNIPVEFDKGTDVEEVNAQAVTLDIGGYILVNELAGKWTHKSTTGQSIDLYDTAQNAVSSKTYGKTSVSGTKIGTAKFTTWKYETGTEEDGISGAKYRIYLYDIEMNSGKSFQEVRSLYIADSMGGSERSFADAVLENSKAVLKDSNKSKLIFDFGTRAIKTLRDSGGNNDNQYQFRSDVDATITASTPGSIAVSISSGFDTGSQPENVTGSTDDFIVSFLDDAETVGIFTASASGNTLTRSTGNTSLDTKFQVGELVKTQVPGGANTGIFKVHSVTSTTVVLDGQPSGATQAVRKYYPAGYIVDFNRSGTEGSRTISGSGQTITMQLQENLASDTPVSVSYKVLKTSAEEKDKLVRRNRYVGIDISSASGGNTGPWTLGISDVFKIKKVYKGTTFSEGGEDVTDQFDLDVNQYDTHYENSQIKLKPKAGLVGTLQSSDKLTVKLDYFEHDRTNGIGYFSVDSYPVDDTTSSTDVATIQTGEIPVYRSPSTKQRFDLRDSVDFRPKYKNQTAGATDIGSIVTINTANTDADHSSFGNYLPVVDSNFQSDLQYYLPRKDKLVMSKEGQLYVTKGVSSLTPVSPRDQGDAITLAEISIPPYPSLAPSQTFGRPDLQTRINLKSYKRYTMRDIGAIDERVSRLEYYTSLNLLEQSAKDIKELDSSGVDRFKNGFFADPFVGHQFGETTDPDYRVAIDTAAGEARPKFKSNLVEMEWDRTGSTNVIDRPNDIRIKIAAASTTLWNYIKAEVDAGRTIKLFQGSNFATATARGTVTHYGTSTLTTERYVYLEDLGGTATTIEKFVNGSISVDGNTTTGTIDGVRKNPRGKLLSVPYSHSQLIDQPMASKKRNPTGEISFNWAGQLELIPSVDTWKSEEVAPEVQIDLNFFENFQTIATAFGTQWGDWTDLVPETTRTSTTTQGLFFDSRTTTTTTVSGRQREGTALEVVPGQQRFFQGEFVTDVSIQPFMRSRLIKVHGFGLRPNTKLFAYFDEVGVSDYVQQWNDDWASNTANFGTNVISDSRGEFYAKFRLPNDDTLKFTVGTKNLKFVDVDDLETGKDVITTSARAPYTSSGLELSKQGLSINTQEATVLQTNPTQREETVSRTSTFEITGWNFNWFSFDDPLAQTFTVPSTTPSSMVSKIDLYFAEKDTTYGIDVQIREVVNGSITKNIVPFGTTTLRPEDVHVSTDASKPTSFTFSTPISLAAGKEYAFVVYPHGGSPRYRIWVSQLGGTDVTTNRLIAKQPSVGVLYTSSNDNVYNAFQSEDVKFKIYRAKFDTSVTGSAFFENSEFAYFATNNEIGSFRAGETVRGQSKVALYNIGNAHSTASTNTNNGTSISLNDHVLGVTSGASGLVRQIIGAAGSNNITMLVDSGTVFTDDEPVKVTRSGNTSDFVFGFINATSSAANTTTFIPQIVNKTLNRFTANTISGGFGGGAVNTNHGYFRGAESNASMQVTHLHDFKVNTITPRFSYIDYGNTTINWEHSIAGNTTAYTNSTLTGVTIGGINRFLEEKTIASKYNNGRTYFIKSTLNTYSDYISPVIDIDKNPSAIAVQNEVNVPYATDGALQAGESISGSNSASLYISKPITLADGQDAEDLKVYITGYKPAGSDFKVFARILSSEDPAGIEDKHYTLLTQITAANNISSTTNYDDFKEFEYGFPTSNAAAQTAFLNTSNSSVVEYGSIGGASYGTFKTFNIKVVMQGNNSVNAPRMTDLRAIALQV